MCVGQENTNRWHMWPIWKKKVHTEKGRGAVMHAMSAIRRCREKNKENG